jgi:hypothetical protein
MKRGYRRTALSRVWQCELHPGDGLEVRHFGRTRFLPNWQPAPIKAPAFFPWGSRFAGGREGFEPSVPLYGELGAPGRARRAIVKVRNADRPRRRVRRAICGVPGCLSHGQNRPRDRDRLPRFRASGGVSVQLLGNVRDLSGRSDCRQGKNEPCAAGKAPRRQKHRTAPFPTGPDSLNHAEKGHDDYTPDANRLKPGLALAHRLLLFCRDLQRIAWLNSSYYGCCIRS